jgi:hypothetical protein
VTFQSFVAVVDLLACECVSFVLARDFAVVTVVSPTTRLSIALSVISLTRPFWCHIMAGEEL